MKKVLLVLLAFTALTFASCGSHTGSVAGKIDSLKSKVDTSKIQHLTQVVDTTAKKVDSLKAKLKK